MLIFSDNRFSYVIDKGCLDAILCGMNFVSSITQYSREVRRVLRPEGQAFVVSRTYYSPTPPSIAITRPAPHHITLTCG